MSAGTPGSVWRSLRRGTAAPVRIGIIGHHVAPIRPPFVGGMEAHTWYLARWLARAGHDVVLFAPEGSDVPGAEVRPLALAAEPSPVARRDVSMPPERFMDAHHAYQALVVELMDDADAFDVLHLQSLHYLPVAMAALLPAPALLTLHTPPTPWLEAAIRARRDCPLRFNAVSRATARLWRPLRVDEVVLNGVDPDAWAPGPGGDGAVWAGRIVPEKAPHLAILAARRAGLRLRLAGPLLDQAYWTAQVEPLLGPDTEFAGHLRHAELGALLGSARVALVTPDWEEPFGLAAAEAMATGTPVAAFARGGLPEVVRPETGRLAAPGDVDALAVAARAAARLPRAAVRAAVARHLGIDAMGRRYEALFERMAAGDRSPGALETA